MKRFYKISCNADSKPVRLIVSVVLAFVVMLFINGFIGSMGGFPAFIAFVLAFYSLRTVTSAGNRIMHQLAMTSKRETGYLLRDYILKYLILWTVFRIAQFFFTGDRLGEFQRGKCPGICERAAGNLHAGEMGLFFCGNRDVCVCVITVSAGGDP